MLWDAVVARLAPSCILAHPDLRSIGADCPGAWRIAQGRERARKPTTQSDQVRKNGPKGTIRMTGIPCLMHSGKDMPTSLAAS